MAYNIYSGWVTPPNGKARYRTHLTVSVASRDDVANTTTIDYVARLEKDRWFEGFYHYSGCSWSIKINGSIVVSGSGINPDAPWEQWTSHLIGSGRRTITHDVDGTKSIPVEATFTGPNIGWAIGTARASDTIDLPKLKRATMPTVTPSPAAVSTVVTIDLPRAVGTYTHDVTWVCGAQSGVIGAGLGASTTWTVPSIMSEYPGRKLAPIVITAETFSGATSLGSNQVTLFAQAPPAPPSVDPRSPSKQFDIQARLVEYSGGEWEAKRTIPASTIQLVDPSSATTTCTMTVSKLNANFDDDSIVDIDVFDGDNWLYTGHRFALARVEGDQVDPTQMNTYSGSEFIDYTLGFAYTQKDYEWKSATPGEIMATLIADAQARNWGPRIGVDFSNTKTSLDESWSNTKIERKASKGTPISQVLEGLVSDGLVEYRSSYHTDKAWLTLLNPGTGSNFSSVGASPVVNLSLVPLSRAPRRASVENRITRVTVAGDDKIQITNEQAAFDVDVFGQMEGWVAASGVTTDSDARKIGDNALRDNKSATDERTFEYASQDVAPHFYPYSVFRPGDWVRIPQGDNTATDRISQITVDKQAEGGSSLTVLTGDRILSGQASLAKRQSAQTGGSISGGNQTTPATLDSRIPASPVVTSVTSVGYWDTDGAAKSAVTSVWTPVVEALDGGDINCDLYEVWSRPAGIGAEWSFRSATDQLTIVLSGWDVLAPIELRLRGRSVDGVFGQFSEDQELTTLAPLVDLDGPIISNLYTDGVGSIFIEWAGVLGTDPAPARMAYVVAEVSTDGGTTYATTGTPIAGPGTIVLNPGAYDTYDIRLRAYDRLGNAGDVSIAQSITTTDPGINPPIPETPTTLAASPGAGWDVAGAFPVAWFDLTWDAVTLDVDGDPIDVAGYDLWGKQSTETDLRYLTSGETNSVRFAVDDSEVWSFQVKVTSVFGGVSGLSTAITATASATVAAPPAPDAPTLQQYAGLLRVLWAGGGLVPQINYVFASISTTLSGIYTRAGMPLQGPGELVIPGLAVGDTYYAKINLVDKRGNTVTSVASAGLVLNPITGTTVQTSPIANTGIKMTSGSLTSYDVSGNPTFILDATTGSVWIAPYDSVFHLGAPGIEAESGNSTTGIAISSEASSFNTFIHSSGVQIRNNETPLSWWEADVSDASLVNFFSPRAVVSQRMRIGDFEMVTESKSVGTRLVTRYKGA